MSKAKRGGQFSPLMFLASLGAGGISIIPFAFLQYTFPHGQGLVQLSQIGHGSLSLGQEILFRSLEGVMILFVFIHLFLTVLLVGKLVKWIKAGGQKEILRDPLKNANILAPFISLTMTMNAFIGPVRFFIPQMAENLQSMMVPALIVWALLFVALMQMEIKLLKTSFEKGFDVSKITFGWLLHPFALSMLTVTGTGIAAIAKAPNVAHIAVFMSLVSGGMGIFLLLIKIISIFQKHFATKEGLGEKQFLPSFLIVIPSITLFAISFFRIGHYLENHHGFHLDYYFFFVIVGAFAFETWYLFFGLSLLKDYFKKHHFKKEFYLTQWGLVCPFVAYAVLGSFVYKVFVPSMILYVVILLTMVVAISFFFDLLIRSMKCAGILKSQIACE